MATTHNTHTLRRSSAMFKEKHFSATIWLEYYKPDSNLSNVPKTRTIKLGCNRSITHSSEHIYTDGTVQATQVEGIFVTYSKTLYNNASTSNLNHSIKPKNNCFLGLNGYMSIYEKKIITSIKVECKSHINSELLNPLTHLEKSITSSTLSTDYETRTDAYRSNPGGYVGFNFAQGNIYNITRLHHFKGKPHLFPEETFHHSELPFEINNFNFEIPKYHDLILLPNFDWFKAINATYILENGKQAMTVSKPYYEYKIDVKYLAI